MSVTAVRKNPSELTMNIISEFKAPEARVWQLWADPRQLERWWGPPTYPATVTTHELRSGGRVVYYMTGPTGDRPYGYWEIDEVNAPKELVFRDGFANADGTPNLEMAPATVRVTIEGIGVGHTRMSVLTKFPSVDTMERMLAMGMEEGMTQALGQIDALLAETPELRA